MGLLKNMQQVEHKTKKKKKKNCLKENPRHSITVGVYSAGAVVQSVINFRLEWRSASKMVKGHILHVLPTSNSMFCFFFLFSSLR